MQQMYDDLGVTRRGIVGEAWFWIAMVILAIVLVAGLVFGIRWITAPAKGKLSAREQINSGNYRIAAYDHFFNLCASIQTNEQALAASYSELSTANGDDKGRIGTNITGQLIARNEAANQYNADARKGYTLGQFRSSQLPYQIPLYQKGQVTSCAA
jgi:hypothetical protein